MTGDFSRKVVVAGVGYSEIARETGRTEGHLALQACAGAIEDSGLGWDAVDGVAAFPDRISTPFEGPSLHYVHRALGLRSTRFWQAYGIGPAQYAGVIGAAYAIASGAADVVVCYRAHLRQTGRFYIPGLPDVSRVAPDLNAYRAPYGVPAGAPRFALMAQRYLHHYGLTEDALAAVVLTCRAHAQLNPRAVWYGKPLTRADYDASDLVASPLRILDCDFPVDGAVAVVLAAADRAPDLRAAPVYIDSMAHATGADTEWEQWPDYVRSVSAYCSEQLWATTTLGPSDVDLAEVYDGFSFIALQWLEDLGICEPGGAGAWLAAGHGSIGGQVPVLTDGGQLGGGRLHGMGKLAEAALQLRGECGDRQVAGAEVAVTTVGTSPFGAAILLTR